MLSEREIYLGAFWANYFVLFQNRVLFVPIWSSQKLKLFSCWAQSRWSVRLPIKFSS